MAPSLARSNRVSRPTKIFKLREIGAFSLFFLNCLYIRDMKKLLLILLSLTLCACQSQTKYTASSSKKACDVTSEEETCNSKDDTKTTFNEISFDEAIQYFTQEKSGVLYFEFSSCPWCKEAKPILKKVAKDNGIDIQYVKVRDEEKNRLYTDEQKAIIEPYIQDYMSNNDEGILTLYVPLVLVVKNGKAIDGHEGTLESHDATERKMTDDEKKELTQIYTKLMGEAK